MARACCAGPTWCLRARYCCISLRANSIGIFHHILRASGILIRFAGSSCSFLAHGSHWGEASELMPLIRWKALPILAGAYLLFALIITMAERFPELRELLPAWLYDAFIPNDKTNIAPYRFLHFVVIAFLIVRFVPRDWLPLERPVSWPVIVCGQQSLEVFCVGIFLSSLAHFVLVEISNQIWMQVLVSVVGIALMTGVAAYRSWSKKVEKTKGPSPAPAPV
jgi:hypothetical protein